MNKKKINMVTKNKRSIFIHSFVLRHNIRRVMIYQRYLIGIKHVFTLHS